VEHRQPFLEPASDTSRDAHDVQIALYRRRGGAWRLQTSLRLSDFTRRLTKAGIRDRHPEYSEEQVRRAFMRLMHGDEVARAIWPNEPLVSP
jgi:hypothetical protein